MFYHSKTHILLTYHFLILLKNSLTIIEVTDKYYNLNYTSNLGIQLQVLLRHAVYNYIM